MPYFFILAAVILRLVPHIPNMAPIAGLALFGGTYLNKKFSLLIPLAAMFISDIFLGFHNTMPFVYGSFFLIGLLGLWLKSHKTLPNIVAVTLFGSILFFIITNFGVWLMPNGMYTHDFAGLVQCYLMGLPFFRNTLAGDIFYVGIMFGLYELIIFVYQKYLKEAHASN